MGSQIEHEKGLLSCVDSPLKAEFKEHLKTHHDIYNGRDQFAAWIYWQLFARKHDTDVKNWEAK